MRFPIISAIVLLLAGCASGTAPSATPTSSHPHAPGEVDDHTAPTADDHPHTGNEGPDHQD